LNSAAASAADRAAADCYRQQWTSRFYANRILFGSRIDLQKRFCRSGFASKHFVVSLFLCVL